MMTEHDVIDRAASSSIPLADRRRPGRQDVAAELIPLLRTLDDSPGPDPEGDEMPVAHTAIFRGLFVGIMLSVPLWAGLYALYTAL